MDYSPIAIGFTKVEEDQDSVVWKRTDKIVSSIDVQAIDQVHDEIERNHVFGRTYSSVITFFLKYLVDTKEYCFSYQTIESPKRTYRLFTGKDITDRFVSLMIRGTYSKLIAESIK